MINSDIVSENHDKTVNKPVGMLQNVQIEWNNRKVISNVYISGASSPPFIGRSWLHLLGLQPLYKKSQLHYVDSIKENQNKLKNILLSHKSFFESGKSSFTKKEIKLERKENAVPKYCLARSVPFALQKKLELELDRLVKLEIIVPVETSEWATPIVPVVKPNGDIRICRDYKTTVNPQLKTIRYAPPNFDDVVARLQTRRDSARNNNSRKRYSKIDLKDAFLQVPVDKDSQHSMIINTHKGLFRPMYMMYGISSGPGFFFK